MEKPTTVDELDEHHGDESTEPEVDEALDAEFEPVFDVEYDPELESRDLHEVDEELGGREEVTT